MASSADNIRLGTCKLRYKGADLGFTLGGVEVEMQTQTKEVKVDQFGDTPVKEYIMGRTLMVKCPLAETSIEILANVLPGATLVSDGVKASGTILIATNPTNGDTIVVNGVTITFKTAAAGLSDVTIGASANATASNLQAVLAAHPDTRLLSASYSVATATVTITARERGTAGNSYTLNAGTAGVKVTLSGATLSGGTAATKARLDVKTGIGTDLLTQAGELVLHPIAKLDTDVSEDFIVPLAAAPGALQFAFKHDEERVFVAEFKSYADSNGLLFRIGDKLAV